MEGTDPAGQETLQEHFSDVCDSALDPSVLARHLFTKKIINNNAREAAKQQLTPKDQRLDNLLGQVMANGTPGAFQAFVEALEKHGAHEWIVKKLIDTYREKGGVWSSDPTHVTTHQATAATGSDGNQQNPTHSTPTIRELSSLNLSGEYQWYHLGLQLGVGGHVLDQIEKKYSRDRQMRQSKMFGEWLRRDTEASWDKLCGALQIIGKEKVIKHITSTHGACGEQEPPHNSTRSPSSDTNIENFVRDLKENYLEMDVLPDEDWPPSIGRHESNLVMIEHGRNTLPGAKEAEEMQRNYVKGNVDDIKNKRKEITYNELFSFLKEKSKSKFRMLIDGAPGVGKTTLCRKFCKDWGAGKILKQFSFVWLLNMREERIAKAKSLDDLFQHYDKDLLREVVQLIKKTGGEGNLLVCDGFDELSEDKRTRCSLFLDIIRGKELPKCSVIVSSRPYASQMLQQMNRITHHVEIVGFTEKQIKECIRKNITDKPKAEELIEQLKQRLDTLSLCYRPLSAAIMIYVYKQEEYTLPTTLTQLYTLYALHSLKRSVTIHFENLRSDDITDLKKLPDPIALPFKALCKMAYNGLHDDQLGFSTSQLPQSLQGCPECKGTKPYLLGFMSGSKSFTGSNPELSYHFTHLTVQEFLAAWYAATELSGEEQTKLFIEKAGDDRFRMMLLFLAGITGLQDTKAYQQIVHHMHFQQLVPKQQNPQTLEDIMEKEEKEEISMLDLIFLSHLIYESQNVSLSPILANSVQQDGKLSLMFDLCNQLECTVVAYFLSTNNFPWKKLELVGLYDDNMDIIYGMCCEHATNPDDSTSDTEVANPPPFLNNAQEVGLQYTFHKQTSSQNLLRFRNLLNVKLVVLTVTFSSVSAQVWHYWSTFLCDKITRHATLKRLDVVIEECSNECEVLQKILKTNSSLQYFKIACSKSCLSDLVVGIFRALVSNTTLEALDMSHSTLQSSPNSSSLPTSSSNTSSHVDAAMAHMLTNNSTLTRLDVSFCGLNPESSMSIFKALKCNSSLETLYMNMNNAFHQAASEALADMLSCNRSLTKLSIIGYEYGCTAHRSRPNLARAIARGLLRNTTLTSVRVWDIEKQSIMEALVDLRKDEGHTRQTDPEVARCDQVLQSTSAMHFNYVKLQFPSGMKHPVERRENMMIYSNYTESMSHCIKINP